MAKNIVFSSIKEAFSSIRRNKRVFIVLFSLQVIFFILFLVISYVYQARIIGSAMAITDYLSRQNLDDASVTSSMLLEKGVLGDDPLMISRSFNEIISNFRIYLALIFFLTVAFACFAWSATHKIVDGTGMKKTSKNFFKIFVVSLFYLGLIFGFFFSLVNFSFMEIAAEGQKLIVKYAVFMAASTALVYFMLISLSLAGRAELDNIVQKTLSIGIRKAHYVLSIYLIGLFMLIASALLLYYFMEKSMLLLLVSMCLMVFVFVFQRIFMVNVVKKLDA